MDNDHPKVTIRVSVRCQACGEVAAMDLTPEAARQTAVALEAAVAGYPPTETLVTGRDS